MEKHYKPKTIGMIRFLDSEWPDKYLKWSGDDDEVLEAIERAKALGLCLRRIWAVSASLPNKERSLPNLIPDPGAFSVPGHVRQHHEHEQCTFDFCQLNDRVKEGRFTAWKLVEGSPDDTLSLLDSTRPYMAVSHVWADGTGAGIWGPGNVNKCLYQFFCGIASEFQCEGCWWDTISIPRDDAMRSKALNTMHNNYAAARVTLVHDLYLREWEWVDAESACIAIAMSPWYSRGWTALELAKSHKVKILFKAKNNQHIIKDLDVDILDVVRRSSHLYDTAEAIRKLRGARIQSLDDLLSILGPRDTSKPRDIPIISGLLTGVQVSGGLSQQEIYQRILRKLGKIASGHLFHNSATMAAPGFSWCPTNILDMHMTEVIFKSELLELQENGDLKGTWAAYSLRSIKNSKIIWPSSHALARVSLRSALKHEGEKHILLAEIGGSRDRALLVRPMRCEEGEPKVVYCRFVGPIYFSSEFGVSGDKDCKHRQIKVWISNTKKMQEIYDEGWKYVDETTKTQKTADKAETTSRSSREEAHPAVDEEDPGFQHFKALLYLGSNIKVSQALLDESSRFPSRGTSSKRQDNMAMFYLDNQNDANSSKSIRMFFYGHERFKKRVNDWLEEGTNVKTGEMLVLRVNTNMKIEADSSKLLPEKLHLAGEALHLTVKNGKEERYGSLVTLLLDNNALYGPNEEGKWPMHFAVENANYNIVESLANGISKEYLDVEDKENSQTALIVATQKGLSKIARLLLRKGASPTKQDPEGNISLHYATMHDHVQVFSALLEYAEVECQNEATGPESAQFVDPEKSMKPNERNVEESRGDTDEKWNYASRDRPPGGGDSRQTRLELAKKANLDFKNFKGKTALHLASQRGNSGFVQTLLESGANPSELDSQKETALGLAIQHGNTGTVDILLGWKLYKWSEDELEAALLSAAEKLSVEDKDKDTSSLETVIEKLVHGGAKSNRYDSHNMTALHWAIKAKNEAIAKQLIKIILQKDLNVQESKMQQSALMMAVDHGLDDTVRAMLERGADIRSKDSNKKTVLHHAVAKEDANIVCQLLKKMDEAMVNEPDSKRRTALHLAAQYGGTKITELLLGANARTSAKDDDDQSALMIAAGLGRVDIVKMIIEKMLLQGSDPTTQDKSGKSALDWAATKGFTDVVLELLKHPNMENDDANNKALKLAAEGGHVTVAIALYDKIKDPGLKELAAIKILFSAVGATRPLISADQIKRITDLIADPNYQDKDGRTALMLAVLNNQRLLFNQLLVLEANPDLQDFQKQTALMMAVNMDKPAFVSALLEINANPNIQDQRGYTALHYAARGNKSTSMEMLFILGVKTDANTQDHQKKTALHLALQNLLSRSRHRSLLRRVGWRHRWDADYQDSVWGFLLQYGARPDIQDENGETPLHWAVRKNRIDIVKMLLQSNPRDDLVGLDIADAEGRTPLLLAAENAYSEIVCFLLEEYNFKPNTRDKTNRTPLLLAAEIGDLRSVNTLLEKNADPNIPDGKSRTPLLLAVRNGHKDVVLTLIQDRKKGKANLDARDNMGRTALLLAAEKGDLQSVNALLEKNADPNIPDEKSRTSLLQAARNGHNDVVLSLIQDRKKGKANLDTRDNMGRTALMLAAENGHDQIVYDLGDADPTIVDYERKKAWQRAMDKGHAAIVSHLLSKINAHTQEMTAVNEALLLASRRGWTEIVSVLLKQKAVITFQNDEGRTALHMAAMGGHLDVVEMLLEKDVSVAIKDNTKRTALMQATENGFESIVKRLLDCPEVQRDISGWMGPEALRCAAENGNKDIVSRIAAINVDYDETDSAGRTAMVLAAANGDQEIVDLLLKHKANPNLADSQNRAPLHHAAWGDHHEVVKVLLNHVDNINASDDGGQTALHLAAERASTGVVRLLLDRGANTNAKFKDGQTALHRAAWGGSGEVVKLLRKSGADPFIRDFSNNKPWQLAAEKGHESIVERLLEDEESMQDERISRMKGLIFAAQKGYTGIAKALLNKHAEPMVKDQEGLTPLHWAAKQGNHEMVKLLIERKGHMMTLDIHDNNQRTPLCLAIQEGEAKVVQLLLEKGADPNITVERGQTILHIAAKEGDRGVVEMLITYKADPHVRDDRRRKAWLIAAEANNHQIVRLLLDKEVDLNPQTQDIEELFLQMATEGFLPMVELLLEKKVDINAKNRLGQVALGLAAENERGNVVELLLNTGANPGLDDSNGKTPLLWAAKSGNLRIMKLLLDSIVSKASDQSSPNASDQGLEISKILNHADFKGQTALLVAIKQGHDEVVELLLRKGTVHGINPNLQDIRGRSALHLAAQKNSQNLIRLLLKYEAKQDLKDNLGRTALLLAAGDGKNIAVETLLRLPLAAVKMTTNLNDTAVDIHDRRKRTALQLAAEQGNLRMAKILLECEADRDCKDDWGRTALLLAVENGQKEVVKLLLENDAQRELSDNKERTPLQLAVANGDKVIVEALLNDRREDSAAMVNDRSLLDLAVQSGNKDVTWLIAERMTHNSGVKRSHNEDLR